MKFKDYIYGKPTIVGFQPLGTIVMKSIHTIPARLQKMLLRLQCYDISLVYKKGKYMYLADTLSRAPYMLISQSTTENDTFEVMLVSYISTAHLEEFRRHTAVDEVLQTLSTLIQKGWPTKESQLQPAVKVFFPYRDKLTVELNCPESPQNHHPPSHCTKST